VWGVFPVPCGLLLRPSREQVGRCLRGGGATLVFEETVVDLLPSSLINIPAHQKHRVELTSPDSARVRLALQYGSGRPA